jgi:hypothetical protein
MIKPLHLLAALLLALIGTAALPAATLPTRDDTLDFENLANGFALDNNLVGVDEWDVDFRGILDKGYAHVSLGIFDVYHPVDNLKDKKVAETFRTLCHYMLALQQDWVEMLEPVSGKLRKPVADLKTLDKWVQSWSTSKLGKLDKKEDLNLLVALKASKKYVEAADRLQTSFLKGETLGLEREDAVTSPIILCPTRYEFVRLVCYAGFVFEEERPNYWTDDLHTWIEGRIMDMRAIALEYVDPENPGDVHKGYPMNQRRDDELEQHVVQRAFLSLLKNYYEDRIDPALAVGLAINIDIDLFGHDHARLEGDPRGRSTPPREVFVPGGNPNGGTLPPLNADSHWREFEGQFRFISQLAANQSMGNRPDQDAKEKLRSFQLRDDDESKTAVIMAPFLGTPAIEKEMPAEDFVGDYLEFFRAYRTVFAEWIRTDAGSSSRDSKKRFGNLMVEMAKSNIADDSRSFEDIIQEVFERPLSSAKPGKEDLEGRFLKWLKQQL